MSINISEDLQAILIEANIRVEDRAKVIKVAEEFEQQKKEERESSGGQRAKNKFAILLRGDANLAKSVQAGWIVQTPEEQDPATLLYRLKLAATKQNEGSKKKKHNLNKWPELFLYIKRKFTKEPEVNVNVKTKEAVQVIVIENEDVI